MKFYIPPLKVFVERTQELAAQYGWQETIEDSVKRSEKVLMLEDLLRSSRMVSTNEKRFVAKCLGILLGEDLEFEKDKKSAYYEHWTKIKKDEFPSHQEISYIALVTETNFVTLYVPGGSIRDGRYRSGLPSNFPLQRYRPAERIEIEHAYAKFDLASVEEQFDGDEEED